MRRILLILISALMYFSLYASSTELDIGGGQKIILNEDGTYEIASEEVESERLIGKQYKADWYKSLDSQFISLLRMADTTGMLWSLDDDAIQELLLSRAPDTSVVFLSADKLLLAIEGEAPTEASYRITPAKELYIISDGSEEEYIGTFNDDYSEICNSDNELFMTIHFVRQN